MIFNRNTMFLFVTMTMEMKMKELLPAKARFRNELTYQDADKVRWLVDSFLSRYDIRKYLYHEVFECLPVSTQKLREVFNSKKVKQAMDFLIKIGFLIKKQDYEKGIKCNGYVIGESFLKEKLLKVKATDHHLIENRSEYKDNDYQFIVPDLEVYYALCHYQKDLTILKDEAFSHIMDMYTTGQLMHCYSTGENKPYSVEQLNHAFMAIEALGERDYVFKLCKKNGRVFNNLSNLPRYLRQFLRLDGQPLWGLDLSNSQPFLFNLVVDNYVRKIGSTPDKKFLKQWEFYKTLTELGLFYDFMIDEIECDGLVIDDKSIFKKEFFRQLFFSHNDAHSDSIIKKTFIKYFSSLYELIAFYKQYDHRSFAVLLQSTESRVFIKEICATLVERYPEHKIIPLHDSVYCKKEAVENVYTVMQEIFQRYGYKPRICIENYDIYGSDLN